MTSLSKYDIVINLMPGIIFLNLLPEQVKGQVNIGTFWQDLCFCYFVGLVIGRVGSLLIEPLVTIKILNHALVHRASYSEYVKAKNLDADIELLNEKNIVYRTMSALCLCVFLIFWYMEFIEIRDIFLSINITLFSYGGFFLLLSMLFVYSMRKQSMYVMKRIEVVLRENHLDEKE